MVNIPFACAHGVHKRGHLPIFNKSNSNVAENQVNIKQNSTDAGFWQPLPLGELLETQGLLNPRVLLLISGWLMIFTACITSVLYLLPRDWGILHSDQFAIRFFLTFYLPLIFCNLLVFWFGFEWGFIPAYLSTFILAFSSGMPFYWAMLFGIAVVLGMAVYALVYYSAPVAYDLRSLPSLAFYVAVTLVASMAGSLGAFIWSHTHGFNAFETITIWKGWWTGTLLQSVFINGPILFLFSRRVERFKKRHFQVPSRDEVSIKWVYGSIITVVAVVSIFIFASDQLGALRVGEELARFPHTSKEEILSATEAFQITAWVAIVLVLAAGMGGLTLVSSWNKTLRRQVAERTRQLEESESRFRATFEQAAVGVAHIDMDGRWLRVNQRLCDITGYPRDELLQSSFARISSGRKQERKSRSDFSPFEYLLQNKLDSHSTELRFRRKDLTNIWVNLTVSLLRTASGDPNYFIAVIEDISERKQAERRLQLSLREKETLLSEIHHRVKNNMAVVSALLELQARSSDDEQVTEILKHAQSRIKSMAMVHKRLYQSESLSRIELDDYIRQLASTIGDSYRHDHTQIHVDLHLDPVCVNIAQAIPCGLILNELLINAYKHAFKGRDEGTIIVRLERQEHHALLTVADDGVGLPKATDKGKKQSLGMKLIHTLAKQLKAEFNMSNGRGTSVTLHFQLEQEGKTSPKNEMVT